MIKLALKEDFDPAKFEMGQPTLGYKTLNILYRLRDDLLLCSDEEDNVFPVTIEDLVHDLPAYAFALEKSEGNTPHP